jgi:4-amino-4-deoxy-L-arabinose transferase-like glycosyltransferase
MMFRPNNFPTGLMAKEKRLIRLFFAFATIFIYFFSLGQMPLVGPDEPRYAQVAREMFERHDWITPTLGGFQWFEKPALLYWLQIISYKIFGVSEFSARFGSAVCGLLIIFSLWVLGKFAIAQTREDGENYELPDWLFLISATSIGLLAFSRGASFDIVLTFSITASLVAFFIFDQSNKDKPVTRYFSLAAFYFFVGVALLAKGLVGMVLPFGVVIFYFIFSRKLPGKIFLFSLLWGTILSLLVALLWYLPMYQAHGWTFIDEFFIQHHFARYVSNKYQHPEPFWFFWLILPLMTIPWLPFLLVSIYEKAKLWRAEIKQGNSSVDAIRRSPLTILAFVWMLFPLLFFSFSGSKLPGYILPAVPGALILTAEYVSRFVWKNIQREYGVQLLALLTFVVVAFILQFVANDFAKHETVKYLFDSSNAQGYTSEKVLNMNGVVHSAEFYAPGRLIRNTNGSLRDFHTDTEIAEELKRENRSSALVLISLKYLHNLTDSNLVEKKILGDNGEIALVYVELKP